MPLRRIDIEEDDDDDDGADDDDALGSIFRSRNSSVVFSFGIRHSFSPLSKIVPLARRNPLSFKLDVRYSGE